MRALADQPCILPISASLNTMSKDGSPLPMNWLLNFPHGHNIITLLLSLSLFFSLSLSFSPSVSRVHFVIGLTSAPWSMLTRLQKLKASLFSNLVFLTLRAGTVWGNKHLESPSGNDFFRDIFWWGVSLVRAVTEYLCFVFEEISKNMRANSL